MRVVLYEERLSPIAGNQRYIQLLSRYAPAAGVDLHLVVPRAGELTELIGDDVPVHLLGGAGSSALGRARRLLPLLGRLRPAGVLCNNSKSLAVAAPASAIRGIPLFWYIKVTARTKPTDLLALYPVDQVFTISDSVLAKKAGPLRRALETKSRLLPIGIDLAPYLAVPEAEGRTPLKVTVLSRIHPAKGLETLVNALDRLGTNGDRIHVTVYGGVPGGREAFAAALQMSALRLPHRNLEFAGWVGDVPQVLADTDVVVLPSLAEGVPRSLVEAMAAARPVIATSVGGIPELVTHRSEGLLFSPGDAAMLAEHLREMRDDVELRRACGRNARHKVMARHDIRLHVERLVAMIREAITQ